MMNEMKIKSERRKKKWLNTSWQAAVCVFVCVTEKMPVQDHFDYRCDRFSSLS